ncbi:hypothetical protein D3C81_857740 [compost metagenome]
MGRGAAHHLAADTVAAGERQLVQARVVAQRRAGFGLAVDDVQHTGGQPEGIGDLAVSLLDQRGDLRGFEHHGAACGQGGRELPGAGHQREVPRHDQADYADGLQASTGGKAGCGQGHVAVLFRQLFSQLGVVAERGNRVVQVDFGFVAGLAVVAHLQGDQRFTALPELLCKTAQVRCTLAGAGLFPGR